MLRPVPGMALGLFLLAAASGLSLAAAPTLSQAQGGPAAVATDTVIETEMSETIAVFGEVVSGRQSRVAARVAGVAAEVPVRVGDRVDAGEVLARLDVQLFEIGLAEAQSAVDVAEAGIATVEARLDRAQKAFRRAESLRANAAIAEAQLEDRFSDLAEANGAAAEARARVEAARTALRRARYDLDNAIVRAPFDAVVLSVATELGQFINAGSEIATLLDTGAMEIEANVPARFVDALQPEQPVEARTDAGGALTLRLRAVLPTEFSSTRTRPVRFDVTEALRPVAVGQSVTLNVPVSAPRTVAAVPKDALIQAPQGWTVFVAAEGKAEPRSVEIGQALGDRFEVISGLSPGDAVVVRGNERLRPGQDIAPTPVAEPAPGGAPEQAPDASQQDGHRQDADATGAGTRVARAGSPDP
ncbi:MAG: efflux RND transporter periplasmic adaptor subunit [Pseudomonadota bacterium]